MNKKIAEYFDGLQVDLIHISQAFAVDNKSPQIEPVHIFRALLHKSAGLVNYIEDSLNEDYYYLIDWCDIHIQQCDKSPYPMKKAEFSRDSQNVIKEAISLEEQYGTETHKLEFLLTALVSPGVGFSSEQLKTMPLSREKVLSYISKNVKNALTLLKRFVHQLMTENLKMYITIPYLMQQMMLKSLTWKMIYVHWWKFWLGRTGQMLLLLEIRELAKPR